MRSATRNILASSIVFIGLGAQAFAQGGGGGGFGVKITDPLGGATFQKIAACIIDLLAKVVAPPVAAIMIVIGALQIMTAGGSPEKISSGKNTLLYTAIGFAIVVGGKLILDLIIETLGGTSPQALTC